MGLLGPNGQPISSVQYRKGKPPKLGEAFGNWAGRDLVFMSLPGGSVVQFDLNRLTLSDFRGMRDHYQVNTSLSVLTFMLHQSDWHIECEDKKIAEHCEKNISEIWTQLNRALCASLWAGFSPNVLQWENDANKRSVLLTKVKDLVPEECSVNWKEEEGWAPPGKVKPKFKVYDGIRQIGARYPVPVENCVVPETPILKSDFTWTKAGDLQVGDELIACDEGERVKGRRYRLSRVEYVKFVDRPCLEVETREGEPITVSQGHPFLVRRDGCVDLSVKELIPEGNGVSCLQCASDIIQNQFGPRKKYCSARCLDLFHKGLRKGKGISPAKARWAWVDAKDLRVGDKIAFFGNPWRRDESREAGYVAGVFDGEGHLAFSSEGNSVSLGFTQRENVVFEETVRILAAKGFNFIAHDVERKNPNWKSVKEVKVLGGRREVARFLEIFSPERLKEKAGSLFDDVVMRLEKSVSTATVSVIADAGVRQVASIQTSTRTYISNGYISHNSLWAPMLMEHGDYYGKKLLRSAFQPYFFSILMHLFANRYYERFGEPVPIGRAPFDDDITIGEQTTRGNEYMLSTLAALRNRSVVVLPNDTTDLGDGKRQFDYSIEYLEAQMRGADFERYLTRLDEEISLAMFTPILLMRTADVGSYNLGVGHMQLYLWMMNALNADRKTYIDKYVLRRMVDFNFSENAPDAKIVFRKLGSKNEETIRAVVTALVTKGQAKPDLEELGLLAGMRLEEIKQTTAPAADPADPNADPNVDPAEDPSQSDPSKSADRREARIRDKKKTAAVAKNSAALHSTLAGIEKRVRPQVVKAMREERFGAGLELSLGYHTRLADQLGTDAAEAFQASFGAWLDDAVSAGDAWSSPEEFMIVFGRALLSSANAVL